MIEEEINKIKNKIPTWFRKPSQINSKILITFLELSNKDSKSVLVSILKNKSDISTFDSNYTQMKNYGENNHGKVFLENNNEIRLEKDIKIFVLGEYEKYLGTENPNKPKNHINTKNIILYGVAGVGKTHNTKKFISLIESRKSEKEIFSTIKANGLNDGIDANRIIKNISDRVKFITFHQSFGYEDFIEGFRPKKEGNIGLEDGIFKILCDDASNDRSQNYYLVIDEINRGNISKIFGELITLIEEDKRDTLEVTLPYSKIPFKIPSNIYIIGTMNTTDKSIALIDIALRRRFTFLEMKPKSELVVYPKAKEIMEAVNDILTEEYQIGHSYFMKIENDEDLAFVLEYKITPLLEEYYYGDEKGLKAVLALYEN